MQVLHQSVLSEFEVHTSRLKEASRIRKTSLEYKNLVDDTDDREAIDIADTLGKRQPGDNYKGDVNLRTLRTLLTMIDQRGWERCVCPPRPCYPGKRTNDVKRQILLLF